MVITGMEVLCATALQDFIFEEEEPASDSEESSSDSQCSDDTTASWDFMCAAEECVNEADQYFRKIPDKLRLKLWPSGYAEEYAGLCRSCAVPCCACVNDGCSNPIVDEWACNVLPRPCLMWCGLGAPICHCNHCKTAEIEDFFAE